MPKNDSTPLSRERLLDFVIDELLQKGIKATTMDSLASALQMSKRTLYEMFSSKENLVNLALQRFHEKFTSKTKDIFDSSDNVMEAMVKSIECTRNMMNGANASFFRDIDDFYKEEKNRCSGRERRYEEIEKLFKKGSEQGVFRKNLDFRVQCRILMIQMESLKRMEELFPPDISLPDAYDAISTGFLRSISTVKGLEYLENMNNLNNEK